MLDRYAICSMTMSPETWRLKTFQNLCILSVGISVPPQLNNRKLPMTLLLLQS
jgi:hypothetical protein